MIGTACFIFFLSLVTGRFLKDQELLKKTKSFFKNVLIFFTITGTL